MRNIIFLIHAYLRHLRIALSFLSRSPVDKCLFLCLLLLPAAATARTLEVGPGRQYEKPSAAAAAAEEGDTVRIAPGEYFDCATWRADRLTIEAAPADPGSADTDVTITDTACGGKGAFVIAANGVTIRKLGFARVRVPSDNGAGIRLEGHDLTVEDSRFVNDQIGILATSPDGGFLRIAGCAFSENGSSLTGHVNYAVRAAGYELLRIERSSFDKARGGGHISLVVGRAELVGNHLVDEGKHMQGPLVAVEGGALLLEGNTIELAAGAATRPGVVLATGEATAIAVRGNTLVDAGNSGVPLLRNWTGQDAVVANNTVPAGSEAATDAGITWHRLRATAADMRETVRELLQAARHLAAALVHLLG
jgi:hypothetical protein